MSTPKTPSFAQAYADAARPAPAELVSSLKGSLDTLRERYPHHEAAVDSILESMNSSAEVTMLEILVAAFMLNGGVVLKHRLEPDDAQSLAEMDQLLDEISRFACDSPTSPDGASIEQADYAPLP